MGILTRSQGDLFVISSDRSADGFSAARPPRRVSEDYLVWTGQQWSPAKDEALTFALLDAADEYVRANMRLLSQV
jgi:hypothetical protein